MEEEEHEVYGGDIPDVEADVDMPTAPDDDSAAVKDLDEMKRRLKEMEEEAAALREMQAKVEKEMGAVQDPAAAAASQASKEEVDTRSIFVGNVDYACTPEEVQQHFQSCGTVNRVTILTDKFGQPKGFAYVEFLEAEAVQEALALTSRPDTFYSSNGVRSVSSEVRTDLIIQVNETRYLLHKFPLLSKCLKLQRLCSENTESSSQPQVIELVDFPGGVKAFELCAKFCYGITVTLSAYNIVLARCAAKYLQMTEDVEKGNLVHKLEVFFNSCILNGWKDCIVTLQTTKPFHLWSEELGITSRCIESLVSKVVSNPLKVIPHSHPHQKGDIKEVNTAERWWGDYLSELRIDLYWRIMAALKSGGKVPPNLIGASLKIYTSKWLPRISRKLENGSDLNSGSDHLSSNCRLLLESIISLLPIESNAVSCSFLLKLLKAVNVFQASGSAKLELARRVALQLDEAKVCDLMIPSVSNGSDTIYDVDIFLNILEQFMLQSQSQQTSSSSALNGSMIKVSKLVDGYLQEIARDVNVPLSKFIALIEAVPELARLKHDDLYKAIDIYLKTHPDLNKRERKDLCRTLDCKKLSLEICMHAAQNELLPLRVVVQVLFSEQTRAAMAGGQLTGLPSNIKALLAAKGTTPSTPGSLATTTHTPRPQDKWRNSPNPSVSRSRMKLDADDESGDGSLKVKQDYMNPSRHKKTMLSKSLMKHDKNV